MSDPQPVKLSYTCTEPRSGVQSDLPPLILHHGLISTKRGWEGLLEPLAEKTNRKVYAIDARNHGDSEKSEVFNFNILATDLDHFMETMKIPKATIIGHCMGGMVAMITALTKPERVEKIIIEDVSPKELKPEMYHVLVDMLKEQVDCLEKVSADEEEATVQQKLRECIYRTIPMIPDEDRDVLQRVQFPLKKTDKGYEVSTNLKVIARAFEDYESLLEQHSGVFDGNVLFIYGTKSTFDVPNDKDFILQLFPKAHFHGIENAGHEVHSQCPEEFLEEVVKFLK